MSPELLIALKLKEKKKKMNTWAYCEIKMYSVCVSQKGPSHRCEPWADKRNSFPQRKNLSI